MTPDQHRAFDYVRNRITEDGLAPTSREIAAHLRVTIAKAQYLVRGLIRAKVLAREPGKHRGLRLTAPKIDLRGVATTEMRLELARRGESFEAFRPEPRLSSRWQAICAIEYCGCAVPRGHLMCKPHWFSIPFKLQEALKRACLVDRDAERYGELLLQARDLVDRRVA